jgi:hypothetical protein
VLTLANVLGTLKLAVWLSLKWPGEAPLFLGVEGGGGGGGTLETYTAGWYFPYLILALLTGTTVIIRSVDAGDASNVKRASRKESQSTYAGGGCSCVPDCAVWCQWWLLISIIVGAANDMALFFP